MEKISAVYKIVNEVTGDSYIGSSKDVKARWAAHKCLSTWKKHPNSSLYQDMQKYGIDKFRSQILAPVMPEYLKQVEQEFIEMLEPTYNNINAKGLNVDRQKETTKKWYYYKGGREAKKKYLQTDKYKEREKKRRQTGKYKEYCKNYNKNYSKKYFSRLCSYNGEILTLAALRGRLAYAGVPHASAEARKYLIKEED